MNWIDVNDKLPEGEWNENHPHLSEEVLITNNCSVNIGFFNRNNGLWYIDQPADQNWIDKITHWMPLPQNPVEILPMPVIYGLVIEVKELNKFWQRMNTIDAKRRVEICVRLDGIEKEFTLEEFKERLGF